MTSPPTATGIHQRRLGNGKPPHILFIHALGGSSESFLPLVSFLKLDHTHTIHLLDLEGLGLSALPATPSPSHQPTLATFAKNVSAILGPLVEKGEEVSIVGETMGCLVALTLLLSLPPSSRSSSGRTPISTLLLLGPPANPLPEVPRNAVLSRAKMVRERGMPAIVDSMVEMYMSRAARATKPLAVAAVRLSLLGQDPEGYARASEALAGHAVPFDEEAMRGLIGRVVERVVVVCGDEDRVSPVVVGEGYVQTLGGEGGSGAGAGAELRVLKGCGMWHTFEDLEGVAGVLREVLGL